MTATGPSVTQIVDFMRRFATLDQAIPRDGDRYEPVIAEHFDDVLQLKRDLIDAFPKDGDAATVQTRAVLLGTTWPALRARIRRPLKCMECRCRFEPHPDDIDPSVDPLYQWVGVECPECGSTDIETV